MENFYFGKYAHLDQIWHPLILTLVAVSTDVYSLIQTNSLPLSNLRYVWITSGMYLILGLVIINSVQYKRRNNSKVYFKWRLILLLTITSLFRIKETMIIIPADKDRLWFLILDLIYIFEVHFGAKALLENMEGNTFETIKKSDMSRVFSKQWTLLGLPLKTLLFVQIGFSLSFFGYHMFYYFAKTRNNPLVNEARHQDISYQIILLALPFLCLVIVVNKAVLVYGIHYKAIRTLTVYYYCKSMLIVSLRLVVVAMLHKEYRLHKRTPFERTIAKLTLLPTGYIFQFELAQILRWISFLTLEAQIPVGDHPPEFQLHISESSASDFFKIAATNKHFKKFLDGVMIPKQSVTLGAKLGEGNFANVYKGEIKYRYIYRKVPESVAVKVLKNEFDGSYYKSVCSELKTMQVLGQHDCLVKFVGVTKVRMDQNRNFRDELGIITELCSEGDLLCYLRKNLSPRVSRNAEGILGIARIMKLWAHQIASGMEFLSSKKIIHGDLAARNVLLNDKLDCKISDFGMSIRLHTWQAYATTQQSALPYRWMAPEVLTDFKFSLKSDVWAFGVLLWEIYSFGEEPYENEPYSDWCHEFVQHRKDGRLLTRPEYCSPEIYNDIVQKCWDTIPRERPDFVQLVEYFGHS